MVTFFKMPGKNKIHFVGIGGISMSALARYSKAQGVSVSGSDIAKSALSDKLQNEGMKVVIGHKQENIKRDVGQIIFNRAIEPNNPELAAARARGIPAIPLAEALGELTRQYKTIAITGAHGKSTTTALIGLILARAKLDPTVFVGTNLKEFGGKNIRIGKKPYLVLEADDFDRAFLRYSPAYEVITNIDREHLDTYKTLSGAKKAFLQFIARAKSGGAVILNRDDNNLFSLKSKIANIARENNIKILWYSLKNPSAKKIKKVIRIPGEHNVSNATGAYALARSLNVPEKTILSAIAAYRGSWRRFEYRGLFNPRIIGHGPRAIRSAPVYDDYAHHPTEIAATLQGFKEKFPKHNLICVFQPHQGKRLHLLFNEFVRAFDLADTVVITPLYKVPGRDEKISLRFSPQMLAKTMQKKYPGKPIFYLADLDNLKNALTTITTVPPTCGTPPGSPLPRMRPAVIVMMGAGTIVNYTDRLLTHK